MFFGFRSIGEALGERQHGLEKRNIRLRARNEYESDEEKKKLNKEERVSSKQRKLSMVWQHASRYSRPIRGGKQIDKEMHGG